MDQSIDTPAEEAQLAAYVIEGARSARSKCKTCRRKIDKGALRLGILIEGPYGTGYLWHHLRCAAKRQYDKVVEAYEAEAWREAKEPPSKLPNLEELQQLREQAEEKKRSRKELPYAEPAPSGRAKCKHCDEMIDKGSLRVVLGRGVYFGSQVRVAPINVHPHCVVAELNAEDCVTEPDEIRQGLRPHSAELTDQQFAELLRAIGDLDGK